MEADESVILMGEEVGPLGGVFTVTRDLIERFGPDRVMDAPLAEASFTGFALGAATEGMRPVVEIMFSDFVMIAMDQIVNHAAKLRYMTNEQFDVPIVVRLPGGGGSNHGPQHSQSFESWFAHTPGLIVAMPSNPSDGYWMMRHAIQLNDPVIFLENKAMYFGAEQEVADEPPADPWAAAVPREGSDLTIVSAGRMVGRCLSAAESISTRGIDCEVIDLRYLWPMDVDTVFTSVAKTSRLLVVSEAVEFCGWSGEVASRVAKDAFTSLDAPIFRVGALRCPIPVGVALEDEIIPTVERIEQAVVDCMDF
ncbi:MAG: alpha-ketoacid dehydrogenase subunit beta [Acidimicrobiia bacterium]|nr:alpha-ketoacid dehydrogenase subunit beta [Acidimicrobiia bacterium]